MRIGRFEADGVERIGRFTDDGVIEVSSEFSTFVDALTDPSAAADVADREYSLDEISYLPPTGPGNTVFCAALNYQAHADEADDAVPDRPLIFLKLARTLVGNQSSIAYHTTVTEEIDYEAELAAVIGSPARHVAPETALDHVAGYTILNDTSARDLQLGLPVGDDTLFDWFSGKAMQATTPVGPYVVVDEIEDPQDLDISSKVNGEVMQDSNTGLMIRSVADLVSFVSSRVQLEPGDIIATGTPEGVGTFQDIRLHHGDEVEIEVEGIGTLVNWVEETSD